VNDRKTLTLPVTIGHDDPVVYHVMETDAPQAYDGFGTFAIDEYNGERTVLIRDEHFTWQTMRYSSGNHWSRPCLVGEQAIREILWKRILGKTQ
jgi:hypothetical protein